MASLKAMAVEETDLGFKLAEIIAISNQKEASSASAERDQSDTTIQTITIVSVSPGIAIQEFVRNLGTAIDDLRLAGDDRTAVVTSSSVLNSVGGYKKGKFTRSTLDGYLELVEHYCRIVLYVVNYDDESAWAKSCAAHVRPRKMLRVHLMKLTDVLVRFNLVCGPCKCLSRTN